MTVRGPTAGSQKTLQLRQASCSYSGVTAGGLLHYDAVAEALASGHIGGLGLDVQWTEPWDPEDPISKHPNVLLTPHVAGGLPAAQPGGPWHFSKPHLALGCCYPMNGSFMP